MVIKEPAVYDTSHWERVPDFALVKPRPVLVMTKATEGNFYRDPTMPNYLADLKQDGIRRGVYHFFRKAYDPVEQANYFINYITPYITSDDILALDFEEGGETADQLIAFLNRLAFQFPTNITLNYSRKNLMDPISMTTAQKDFLKQYPTWIAGYPTNPDLYSSIPPAYIPDQTKWGVPWLWQYTDRGMPEGTSGDGTDCNWIDPVFYALIADVPVPPAESIRRFDSDCYVKLFNPDSARFSVSNTHGLLEHVTTMGQRTGAKVVINGDGWFEASPPFMPISLSKSDGDVYQDRQYDFRPFLAITNDNRLEIIHNRSRMDEFINIVSGTRYMIRDGIKQSYLNGSEPVYQQRDPRTGVFITRENQLGLIVVDGRSSQSAGVTLSQLADVMLEFNAYHGLELDGGGSSSMAVDGELINRQSEPRPVVNHLLVFSEGESPMSDGLYEMKTITADTRMRPTPNTEQAYIALIPAGVTLRGKLFLAPVDSPPQLKGDMWLETTYGSKTGWVAYLHAGGFICKDFKVIELPTGGGEPDPIEKPSITISVAETDDYPAGQLVINPKP